MSKLKSAAQCSCFLGAHLTKIHLVSRMFRSIKLIFAKTAFHDIVCIPGDVVGECGVPVCETQSPSHSVVEEEGALHK